MSATTSRRMASGLLEKDFPHPVTFGCKKKTGSQRARERAERLERENLGGREDLFTVRAALECMNNALAACGALLEMHRPSYGGPQMDRGPDESGGWPMNRVSAHTISAPTWTLGAGYLPSLQVTVSAVQDADCYLLGHARRGNGVSSAMKCHREALTLLCRFLLLLKVI